MVRRIRKEMQRIGLEVHTVILRDVYRHVQFHLVHCFHLMCIQQYHYTVCPTCYRTRHFFNNFTTNENIATTTYTSHFLSHTTNLLLFKFRCNIFIGVRLINEMPSSVASGTSCIRQRRNVVMETDII